MKFILAILTLSILLTSSGIALAAMIGKPADADNFYKSDKVTVQKVKFPNQYRIDVAGDLFVPKDIQFTVKPVSAAELSAPGTEIRLRMSFEGKEVLINLFDTQAGRELAAMLPLTLSFEDYAKAEKIAHLTGKLSSGVPPSESPSGDFTYYSPWGNLAVFYKGYGQADGLYILGKIISGKEKLAGMSRNFNATLDVIKQ